MDEAVQGLTTYAALRMLLPDSLSGISVIGGIGMSSSKNAQERFRTLTIVAHYYVLTSVVECLIHKYQMHGKLFGEWINPHHIDHHLNVSHDMTLKHNIEEHDNSGELGWLQTIGHATLLHLLTMGYVSRTFGIRPMTNALIWAGISMSSSLLWNTFHNSMHDDDHRHSIRYGPPRMFDSKKCSKTFGKLFKILKRHHELHHVIKPRKTNFCIIFLGADKLFGFTPTRDEMMRLNTTASLIAAS